MRAERARASEPSASRAFVLWWLGIGAYLFLQGSVTIAVALGDVPPAIYMAIAYVGDALIALALWGITYYVAYLWTGRAWLRRPLGAFFALLGSAFVIFQIAHHPNAIDARRWLVTASFAQPLDGPLYAAILACFALPPIAACVGYLSLLPRAPARHQRYRIVLVSLGIILYLGSGLVVRLGSSDALMFVNLALVGLGTAAATLLAYRPPRAWHVWLGIDAS